MRSQENHNVNTQKILDLTTNLRMPLGKSKESAWQNVSARLFQGTPIMWVKPWMKVAATLTLVVMCGYLTFQTQHVEVTSARAQQMEVFLPDNSSVLLNAESHLSYNAFLWGFRRRVFFEGEGFFNVQEGKRFLVQSAQGSTEVVGTSFNINTRDNRYQVSCTSGKVRVILPNNRKHILSPGFQASSGHEVSTVRNFDENKTLAWRRGGFYFESAALQQVFTTLERQYNVTVQTQNIDLARAYTGYFTNKDIEEALKVVCLPMGLSYKITDAKNIIIFNESKV